MTWHDFFHFINQNRIVFELLTTAAIATMPGPGSPFNLRTLYTWMYDCAHLFSNLKHPTKPAETPANPKP